MRVNRLNIVLFVCLVLLCCNVLLVTGQDSSDSPEPPPPPSSSDNDDSDDNETPAPASSASPSPSPTDNIDANSSDLSTTPSPSSSSSSTDNDDSLSSSDSESSTDLDSNSSSEDSTETSSLTDSPSESESNKEEENDDDDQNSFKVVYLVPLFVIISLLFIATLIGWIWGRHKQHQDNSRDPSLYYSYDHNRKGPLGKLRDYVRPNNSAYWDKIGDSEREKSFYDAGDNSGHFSFNYKQVQANTMLQESRTGVTAQESKAELGLLNQSKRSFLDSTRRFINKTLPRVPGSSSYYNNNTIVDDDDDHRDVSSSDNAPLIVNVNSRRHNHAQSISSSIRTSSEDPYGTASSSYHYHNNYHYSQQRHDTGAAAAASRRISYNYVESSPDSSPRNYARFSNNSNTMPAHPKAVVPSPDKKQRTSHRDNLPNILQPGMIRSTSSQTPISPPNNPSFFYSSQQQQEREREEQEILKHQQAQQQEQEQERIQQLHQHGASTRSSLAKVLFPQDDQNVQNTTTTTRNSDDPFDSQLSPGAKYKSNNNIARSKSKSSAKAFSSSSSSSSSSTTTTTKSSTSIDSSTEPPHGWPSTQRKQRDWSLINNNDQAEEQDQNLPDKEEALQRVNQIIRRGQIKRTFAQDPKFDDMGRRIAAIQQEQQEHVQPPSSGSNYSPRRPTIRPKKKDVGVRRAATTAAALRYASPSQSDNSQEV